MKKALFIKKAKQYLNKTWFFPRHIHQRYMRLAILHSKSYIHGTLVDIGCGTRPYETMLEDMRINYIGVDWPVSSDRARQNITCDANNLSFRAETVDTVLATELIEHLQDPNQFLSEVTRILKIGGVFLLSAPFLEPIHEEPRDFYRFTPYALRMLLEKHGLSIKHIWDRGHWWSVVLGSFVPQALYSLANPLDNKGIRRYRIISSILIMPFCALSQIIGYAIDRISSFNSNYTMGFFIIAVRER